MSSMEANEEALSESSQSPQEEAPRLPFKFDAPFGELFKIYILNILLTVGTLGVYTFWAQARMSRFLYENTVFNDSRFGYHATGLEKFLGFLKALPFILVAAYLFYLLYDFLSGLPREKGDLQPQTLTMFAVYGLLMLFGPLLKVARERFRLGRSSWRGLRFRFHGRVRSLYWLYLTGVPLTLLTLGIYFPWFYTRLHRYYMENSSYGSERFAFHGRGWDLFKICFKGILLTVLSCGIYAFWFQAALHNYVWNHTSVQGRRFESRVDGAELLGLAFVGPVILILTFTLGLPILLHMRMTIYVNKLSFADNPDLARIRASRDPSASALADGISHAADSISDFLGG